MKNLEILFLFLSSILLACSNDDAANINSPLVEIRFSESPINLEGIDAQFASDIAYDAHEQTTFDIFIPKSPSSTSLVIYFHGGGFRGGDKSWIYEGTKFPNDIRKLLRNGTAVATVNYRLLHANDTEGVLKCLHDSRRALQYIRYLHNELNVVKEDIMLFGNSAGAGTALWLATHDDMKDEVNPDPVLRESTRVKSVALTATQCSFDIENRWVDEVFSDFDVSWSDIQQLLGEEVIFPFYGIESWSEYESSKIDDYRSQIDMLAQMTSDDPDIWISNIGISNVAPLNRSAINHHPFHAREIKKIADSVGIATVCRYGNPQLFSSPNFQSYVDLFLN